MYLYCISPSTTQILENLEIKADNVKGRKYFEGSVKFMKTLNQILHMLILEIDRLAAAKLHESFVSQAWGVITLMIVLTLAPILVFMAKNAISSIQIFALSVEKKSEDMKRQKRKQEKLIYKMLPKMVVERVMAGDRAAETFESATLYFSSVVGFS